VGDRHAVKLISEKQPSRGNAKARKTKSVETLEIVGGNTLIGPGGFLPRLHFSLGAGFQGAGEKKAGSMNYPTEKGRKIRKARRPELWGRKSGPSRGKTKPKWPPIKQKGRRKKRASI